MNPTEVIFWIGSGIVFLILIELILAVARHFNTAQRAARSIETSSANLQRELEEVPDPPDLATSRRAWRGYRRFILEKKVEEARDICSFYLSPIDMEPLPTYKPGQHLGFQLRIPGRLRPTVRNYSLSTAPGNPNRYKITVKQLTAPPEKPDAPPGRGSTFMHESLSAGNLVEVSCPSGKFILDREDSRPAVFVAGGIGVTPLMSMIESICNENIERRCFFIHAVRNRSEHAFHDQLQQIAEDRSNIDLHVFYSHPEQEDDDLICSKPTYHSGFLDVESLNKITGGGDLQYYICGPPPMMSALVPALELAGVSPDDLLTEAFGPASTSKKVNTLSTESGDNLEETERFKVFLETSNRTLKWDGSSSLLELVEASGIFIDSSCRSGNCGTCEARLLDGPVQYEEEPGVDIASGHCLTCVARPAGDVILEL